MNRTVALSLLTLLLTPAAADADTGSFQAAGTMLSVRYEAASTRLADGSVLVAGGGDNYWDDANSVERYDPATGRWSALAPMDRPHVDALAVTLADGRVLVAGGDWENGTAELYDPARNAWTQAPMDGEFDDTSGTLLADGRVLATADGLAEVFDPRTNDWTPTGDMVDYASDAAAVRLADGSVLVAGGDDGYPLGRAEVYHPGTNAWTAVAPMPVALSAPAATLLGDGHVLVVQGGVALLYDPVHDAWSRAGYLNNSHFAGLTLTTLTDGRALVVGGGYGSRAAEIYDPALGAWMLAPALLATRSDHFATLLGDGSVLIGGGFTRSAERFVLTKLTVPPVQPPATAPPDGATPSSAAPSTAAATPAALAALPAKLTFDKHGRIAVKLTCTGSGKCRDKLVLKVSRGRTLASQPFELFGGTSASVKLTLSRANLRKLARKTTKVTLSAVNHHISVSGTLRTTR